MARREDSRNHGRDHVCGGCRLWGRADLEKGYGAGTAAWEHHRGSNTVLHQSIEVSIPARVHHSESCVVDPRKRFNLWLPASPFLNSSSSLFSAWSCSKWSNKLVVDGALASGDKSLQAGIRCLEVGAPAMLACVATTHQAATRKMTSTEPNRGRAMTTTSCGPVSHA